MTTTNSESAGVCGVVMRKQEIAPTELECVYFMGVGERPSAVTAAAKAEFSNDELQTALRLLDEAARANDGIDYLAVFDVVGGRVMWAIDDGERITLMVPSDY